MERNMILCTDKYVVPLCNYAEGITKNDTDVILILSSQSALRLANEHFKRDDPPGPDLYKITECESFLARIPQEYVRLPVISFYFPYHVIFQTGRHRTTVFAGINQTVPVLTCKRMADQLQNHWGSQAQARTEYDFSSCTTQTFIGNP